MNATWTVKVERMQIRLAVGIYADELEPQTIWVSLMADGVASASPQFLDQCFDYEPLCHWLTNVWPRTPHTPLLETRINELLGFVFGMDERLETAWVGLYKQRMSGQAVAVGIERRVTRAEFFTEQQTAALPVTQPVAKLSKNMKGTPMQLSCPNPVRYVLTLAAASARGQVAALSALLERHDAYIEEFAIFDDVLVSRFYVRAVFRLDNAGSAELGFLREAYDKLIARFDQAEGAIHELSRPTRVLIMVSKADHCLRNLLDQWRRRELNMDVVAVVSNHADLGPIVQAEGLPFYHLPITAATKPQQEAALLSCIQQHGAELVVLARYMQVLSEDLCQTLAGRVINIHHSFLPGFKGARPYEQAHARGVKLIGATAHFATSDLDEGPIIEQSLERVDHAFSPEQLLSTGRDVECLALGRALRYVLEHRVFINGLRTVVLR